MVRIILVALLSVCIGCHEAAASRHPAPPVLYEKYKDVPLEELHEKGKQHFLAQRYDSAAVLLTMVVQRDTSGIDEKTRKIMAKARNTLGIMSFMHSNYPAAYSHFLKSIQLYDVADASGYMSLASVYVHYGDKLRAFEYLKNYFDYAVAHDHYNEANIGMANILTTNYKQAGVPKDSIDRLVRTYLELPDVAWKLPSHALAYPLARGWVMSNEGRHIEAVDEIKTVLSDLDTVLMPRSRHSVYMVIADQFKEAGMKDSALHYIKMAEDLARVNDYKDLLSKTYSDASDIYAAFGDADMSTRYRYRMLEINDSLFNPRELGKLHDLNMFHEIDKFERKIEVMAVRDRMRLTVLWTVGIALVVVIALLFVLFRQNRDLRRKNRTLFERNLMEMANEKDGSAVLNHTSETSGKHTEKENYPADLSDNDISAALENEGLKKKYTGSNLSDETRMRLLRSIEKVFKDEEIFCKEGFSLVELAQLCESNSRYVSQVLNEDMIHAVAQ